MTNEEFIKKLDELPTIEIMFAEILKQEFSMRNVSFATGIELSVVSKLASGKKILQENLLRLIKRFLMGKEYIPTSNLTLRILIVFKKNNDFKWLQIAHALQINTPFLFSLISERIELSEELQKKIKSLYRSKI